MAMSLVKSLPWLPSTQGRGRMRVIQARILPEDYPNMKEMPLEAPKPRFDHIPYSVSTPEIVKARLESQVPSNPSPRRFWRSRRRWGSYKKPTAKEAMTSSIISGICSFAAFKAVMASYDHVAENPLPFVVSPGAFNETLQTMIMGFGMLGVSLFAISSVGLGLLSLQLFYKNSSLSAGTLRGVAWCVLLCYIFHNDAAQAINVGASETFGRSCMGCHIRGGNILQPGATLSLEDLKKNGISTTEDIFKITYFGKGRMPGFGEKCTPTGQCTFGPRLSDAEIQALAEFVKSQAQENWPVTK